MRRLGTARGTTLVLGTVLVAIGGVGDLVFHALPESVSRQLLPLVGQDGGRAHLVTAAGVGVMLFAVLYNALLASDRPG